MIITGGNYYNAFAGRKKQTEKTTNKVNTETVNVRKRVYKPDIREQEYVPIKKEAPWFIDGWYKERTTLPSERYKAKSSLRENEWFNEDTDENSSFMSPMYDIDDVPYNSTIMSKIRGISQYNYSDIDTFIPENEIKFNRSVHSPWINDFEQEDMTEYLQEKENIILNMTDNDTKIVKDIFENSQLLTGGKNQISKPLCDLSVELLSNSGEWGACERNILRMIKIPIYKNVYGNYSKTKYHNVLSEITEGNSNEIILYHLVHGPSNAEMFL